MPIVGPPLTARWGARVLTCLAQARAAQAARAAAHCARGAANGVGPVSPEARPTELEADYPAGRPLKGAAGRGPPLRPRRCLGESRVALGAGGVKRAASCHVCRTGTRRTAACRRPASAS